MCYLILTVFLHAAGSNVEVRPWCLLMAPLGGNCITQPSGFVRKADCRTQASGVRGHASGDVTDPTECIFPIQRGYWK